MMRISLFSVFVLMLVSFSVGGFAQDAEKYEMKESDKGIEVSSTLTMTATVQAINASEREVVLRNSATGD